MNMTTVFELQDLKFNQGQPWTAVVLDEQGTPQSQSTTRPTPPYLLKCMQRHTLVLILFAAAIETHSY